jgi:hypothetical protein
LDPVVTIAGNSAWQLEYTGFIYFGGKISIIETITSQCHSMYMKHSPILVKNKDKNKDRNIATIQIRKKTPQRLGKSGSMNETYDDFINRLLDYWEKSHGKGEGR